MSYSVTFDMGHPVSVDAVSIGENGEIQLISNGKPVTPAKSWTGSERARDKGGEKSLFRVPQSNTATHLDELYALSTYDCTFVLDTNTIVIGDSFLSVASVAQCKIVKGIQGPGSFLTRTTHVGAFEFRGLEENQERFGWLLLQHAIVNGPSYNSGAPYLIVSDHGLSEHDAINDREIPIYGNEYLATNLTLGYATSDSGRSYIQKVIRQCDHFASDIIKAIRAGQIDGPLPEAIDAPVSHLRLIIYTQSAAKDPLAFSAKPFVLSADLPYMTKTG